MRCRVFLKGVEVESVPLKFLGPLGTTQFAFRRWLVRAEVFQLVEGSQAISASTSKICESFLVFGLRDTKVGEVTHTAEYYECLLNRL